MKNINTYLIVLYTFILLLFAPLVQGQNEGMAFHKNFSPEEYKAATQNWVFATDKRGLIYVANTSGILEYDGKNWRKIQIENGKGARTVAIDSHDRIYYGSPNSFGYLTIDSLGNYQTVKLSQIIEEKYQVIPDVWRIRIINDEVYYQSLQGIYKFTPYKNSPDSLMCTAAEYEDNLQAFFPKNRFFLSFVLDKRFFITDMDLGLMTIENDSLVLAKGAELFENEIVYGAVSFKSQEPNKKSYLLALGEKLLIYTPESETKILKPFNSELDEFYQGNLLYGLNKLSEDRYLVSSIKKGAIVIDERGKIIESYNEKNDLQSNTIFSTYLSDKVLWFALSNGISKFEFGSNFRYWSKADGIKGDFNCAIKFENKIYIGTDIGIFVKDSLSKHFSEVEESMGQTMMFLVFNDKLNKKKRLFAGQSTNFLEVSNGRAKALKKITAVSGIESQQIENAWIIGSNKLTLLRAQAATNDFEIKEIGGIDGEIRSIAEDKHGNIWCGTQYNWLYKITKTDFFNTDTFEIVHFDTLQGLPNKENVKIFNINDEMYAISDSKFYKYNETDSLFYLAKVFGIEKIDRYTINYEANGNVWVSDNLCLSPLDDGTFKHDSTVYKRLQNESIQSFYQISEDKFLFCTNKRVYQYRRTSKKTKAYHALIRRVMMNTDSTLFEGEYFDNQGLVSLQQPVELKYILPYRDNSLSFSYAAAFFEDETQMQYTYKLEGYNDNWSKWSKLSEKEYTNLNEGKYTFMVKAKNVYGEESELGTFEFTILPPWYRSWWAYTLYLAFLILLIWGIVKFNERKHIREKIQLENTVKERTAEIYQQKEEILAQSENLLQANEEINATSEILSLQNKKLEKAYTNVQLLSEIGQKVASNLSVETIIETVYENVNRLMDAQVFSIGIFNEFNQSLDFHGTKENDETLPYHFDKLNNKNTLSIYCYNNFETVLLKDFDAEITNYLQKKPVATAGELPESLIYLPLGTADKKVGVISVQSFKKNAYSDYHLNILRNIAVYTTIALENADAYLQIKKQHNEITSSVNYASTIQNAMLPAKENMDKLFENFIFYRPKDIVSGDFYWVTEVDNKIFVAVVDCTGHGVPGAFMSMIGSRLLNEIVNERKILETDAILEQLNIDVRKALRQDQTDNTDGMDVCLCRIEKNNEGAEISFTGAKRPLFVYQSEKLEVLRLLGNKKTVGGKYFQKMQFSQTKLRLKKGDIIYLTTDGYVDQNNPERKKFTTPHFMRLLNEIKNNTLSEQRQVLENQLDKWKNSEEQRDDISIVGIKI